MKINRRIVKKGSFYLFVSLGLFPVFFLCSCCKTVPDAPDQVDSSRDNNSKQKSIGKSAYILMSYEMLPSSSHGRNYRVERLRDDSNKPYDAVSGSSRQVEKKIGHSHISYFDTLPSGNNVSNFIVHNTLNGYLGSTGGGLYQIGNEIFRKANSSTLSITNGQGPMLNTPVRLVINGRDPIFEIVYKEIFSDIIYVSKNFTTDGNVGYLLLANTIDKKPAWIYTFNPQTMMHTEESHFIDFDTIQGLISKASTVSPELLGADITKIVLGMNVCIMHDDKLILDAVFETSSGVNLSPDIYLIAVDPRKDDAVVAFSTIKNTGLIGQSSECTQASIDEKGDLYLLSRGSDLLGFYRNSKIVRIKAGEYTVDPTWELAITDVVMESRPARFNSVFVRDGKLVTMVNEQTLSANTDNASMQNLWQYYIIDVKSKKPQKIAGLQSCSAFIEGANNVSFIDGKEYIRYVRTGDDHPYNGYYELNLIDGSVKPAFNVTTGGYVLDLKKIKLH